MGARQALREDVCGDDDRVFEVSTRAWDASRLGIGSSPYPRDVWNGAIAVPAAASAPDNRYVMRLCAYDVPAGESCELLSIRQLVVIGGAPPGEGGGPTVEREVESPLWSFDDGNVSWHVAVMRGRPRQVFPAANKPGVSFPSESRDIYGVTPALLFRDLFDGHANPYQAPRFPAFDAEGDLHTIYTLEAPWRAQPARLFSRPVIGPALLVFFATVKQTNGQTPAPVVPFGGSSEGLRREDQFRIIVPGALYTRLAGAMLLRVRRTLSLLQGGKDLP